MIHCASKLLLGSQHHPAFISKQSLNDNKKHVKETCPVILTHTLQHLIAYRLLKRIPHNYAPLSQRAEISMYT